MDENLNFHKGFLNKKRNEKRKKEMTKHDFYLIINFIR